MLEKGHGTVALYLACTGLTWYFVLWAISLLGCLAVNKRYKTRTTSPWETAPVATLPGVSILRPLKGLDANLHENLESTFKLTYANFEILFSVADSDDQALDVVRSLMLEYPHINAQVIIGQEIVGANPKVNNLIRSYRRAKNDIIWVLDSNVRVKPGTLARSVDSLLRPSSSGKRIALVHHVPFAVSSSSYLGSRVEQAFLNTNHAKMYVAINTVAIESCVVGKSNLYRRSDLDLVNGSRKRMEGGDSPGPVASDARGLAAFGKFLAEDNSIASSLWHELDLRHDLSVDVVHNVVGDMTMADYVWRRVRWIRVRKHMVLTATLLEPFTESLVLSCIGSASCRHLFGVPAWLFFALHYALWLQVDLSVYSALGGKPLRSTERWPFLQGWLIREALALPIFLLAIFGDTVVWRGKRYRIIRDGEVQDEP